MSEFFAFFETHGSKKDLSDRNDDHGLLLHMASFSVKNKVESARNHQPCLNTVHQIIPRLKPGGRKKLCDRLKAQGRILLIRHDDSFTEKKIAIWS
ncbi:MAG: hypothetical protein C4B58_08830 [Deltaproteobacteria bacterium]|nr:MAG: hypothetical protein C4B58_08830 [Deltaproteobacteria bacterium]